MMAVCPPGGLRKRRVIKGTAVDTLWPVRGVGGGAQKNQIDCVSTNAAGKREGSLQLCNLKSKINDVPIWKGREEMEVKFNKIRLKSKASKGLSLQLGSS